MDSDCILPSQVLYVIQAKVRASGILSQSITINRLLDTTGLFLYLQFICCHSSVPHSFWLPFGFLVLKLFLVIRLHLHCFLCLTALKLWVSSYLSRKSSVTIWCSFAIFSWWAQPFPFVFFLSLHLWTSWLIYLSVDCLLNLQEKF